MSKWFYYNENGEKIEVTGGRLKGLAKAGMITPETIVETEEGKKAKAGKVKGLTFLAAPPQAEAEVYGMEKQAPETPSAETDEFAALAATVMNPSVEMNPFTSPMPASPSPVKQFFQSQPQKPPIDIDEHALMATVQEEIDQSHATPPAATNPFTVSAHVANHAMPQGVAASTETEGGNSSWQITLIGAVLILIIGGIGWAIISSSNNAELEQQYLQLQSERRTVQWERDKAKHALKYAEGAKIREEFENTIRETNRKLKELESSIRVLEKKLSIKHSVLDM